MNEASQASTSGQPQTPIFNPRDREHRQRFIRDTLSRSHQWDPDQWDRLHFDAQQEVAAKLHSRDQRWVSESWFDLATDALAWGEYIRPLNPGRRDLEWPWDIRDIGLFEGGHSETYKAWREARGYQATTSRDRNDSGEHAKSQPETTTSLDAQIQGMEARCQAMEARLVEVEARVDQKAMDIRMLRQQYAKNDGEIRSLRDRVAQLENAQ